MLNKAPIVIKPENGIAIQGAFGGRGYRMLTDRHSHKLCIGILKVDAGMSPHRWHAHDTPDEKDGFKVVYPEGFEEAYLIVEGRGVLQWKEAGQLKEKRVETGDAVYFPMDVYQHQLLNDQEMPMTVFYATSPPVV